MDTVPIVVQLDGGLGRVICAEPALRSLAATGRTVQVLTSWPELFANNPSLHKVYNLNREYLFDDVIRHGELTVPEPYWSRPYYTREDHLITSFQRLLGVPRVMEKPRIYFTQDEIDLAQNLLRETRSRGKYVVGLQPFGSTAQDVGGDIKDPTFRSITVSTGRFLINRFKDSCVFVNMSHVYIENPNIFNPPQPLTTRQYMALAREMDFVFTVDSFLAHLANACERPGVLVLNSTFEENVGYANTPLKKFSREGYPKSYQPNRIAGYVELNQEAMNYSEEDLERLASIFAQTLCL